MSSSSTGSIFRATNPSGKVVYKVEVPNGYTMNGRRKKIRRTAATKAEARILQRKLIADIAKQSPGFLNHRRMDRAFDLVHDTEVVPGSLLAKITRKHRLGVNSTHHQAIAEPADPFVATARSCDGLVEAIELRPDLAAQMPFLLGVQFHPERLVQKGACYRAIFRSFVLACQTAPPAKKFKRANNFPKPAIFSKANL